MNPRKSNRTIKYLIVILGIIGSVVISNVLFTMVTAVHMRSGVNVLEYKSGDYIAQQTISAPRGSIKDRSGEIIAQDQQTYTIYAVLNKNRTGIGGQPAYVTNPQDVAIALAPRLNMSEEEVLSYLTTAEEANAYQAEFGQKGKNISVAVKEEIEAIGLAGIEFTESSRRYYPNGKFASHLVGYAQYDETEKRIVGKMGAEAFLDEKLIGTDGKEIYEKDANNNIIPGTKHEEKKAIKGNDVYLTLDKNVQQALETALSDTIEKVPARKAWGIVMEVETGKILGWSSYPTFDLNTKEGLEDNYLNVPSAYQYEPGSVMKGFTYAAALDSNTYPKDGIFKAGDFNVGYDPSTGKILRLAEPKDGYGTISDALGKDFGTISFDMGFLKSSNVGICELLANYLEPTVFEQYLDKFGFFTPVGTEGLIEASGLKSFEYPIDKLSTGFGQASSVTALQLVQGYSAIFNSGKMMKPYYIDRIVDGYNTDNVVEQFEPQVVGQPISEETSEYMCSLMRQVVDDPNGTAHYRYKMDDVNILAKTGTGEIFENGAYNKEYYTSSVIAAAPAEDPKIMMYYAFESKDILDFSGEYFKQAFKEALIAANITGDKTLQSNNKEFNDYQDYTMPSLVNHTSEYAANKLTGIDVNRVILGDGNSVVKQYPAANEIITTGQNIYLLTDGTTLKMPNMIGWTRKDVSIFWDLTGISISMDGYGIVTEQNISEGDVIDKHSEISLKLK